MLGNSNEACRSNSEWVLDVPHPPLHFHARKQFQKYGWCLKLHPTSDGIFPQDP